MFLTTTIGRFKVIAVLNGAIEMYFKVVDEKIKGLVWGEIHWGQHVAGPKPHNYILFGGMMADVEEFLAVLISLPPHRQWSADLHHFVWCCTPVAGMPQTTLVADAVKWTPQSDIVLYINTIPFSKENARIFFRWLLKQVAWVQRSQVPLQVPVPENLENFLLGPN